MIRSIALSILSISYQITHAASPEDLVASALVLEAVGEGTYAMHAVANVIQNRAVENGTSMLFEMHQSNQFQGFISRKDPIAAAHEICSDGQWRNARKLARAALDGHLSDVTNGATHFHSATIRPSWSYHLTPTVRIRSLIFYRDQKRDRQSP